MDSRCVPTGAPPLSIDDALARLNALPDVSLPCFVASLPRPLRVTATSSPFSAQPAFGVDRPRVFLHSDGLVLSLALGGAGHHLLEFGEWTDELHTIKGELSFPLEVPVLAEDPFADLAPSTGREGTSCGLCHRNEIPVEGRPGAFSSAALQPRPGQLVNVEYLRTLVDDCDAVADPHGCAMLHAIFDYGEVVHEDFDEDVGSL